MILVVGKAAECHIVPEFKRLIAKFYESLIEFDGDFRLIFVEEVGCYVGYSLNVTILDAEGLFVVEM